MRSGGLSLGEREILWFFYGKSQDEPKRYFSIREVSKALKQEYSSVNKQIKKLWFIDYLIVRKKRVLSMRAAFFNSVGMYRLNGEKMLRCRRIFKKELEEGHSDVPMNKSTYLSSKKLGEEKLGRKGEVI